MVPHASPVSSLGLLPKATGGQAIASPPLNPCAKFLNHNCVLSKVQDPFLHPDSRQCHSPNYLLGTV